MKKEITNKEKQQIELKKVYWNMKNNGVPVVKIDNKRWGIYMSEGQYLCSDGTYYHL